MKLSTLALPAVALLFAGPASVAGSSEGVGNDDKHPSLRREQPAGHADLSSFERELQEQVKALIAETRDLTAETRDLNRRLDEKDVHEQALMRRLDEQDAELRKLRPLAVTPGSVGGGRNLQGTLILTQEMVDDLTALLAALTAFDGNDAGEQFSNAIATPVELDRIREVLRYLVPNGDIGQLERLAALDTDSLTRLDADQLEIVASSLDRVDPDGLNAITMPGVVEKLQGLTGCLQPFAETEEVIVQGCDFIVRGNGGSTSVDPTTVSGKGNLIVGYNEGSSLKTGLNNLVVGSGHSYNSTGGVVFGKQNTISPWPSSPGPPGPPGPSGAGPKIDALADCMATSSSDEVIIQGCDFIVRGNGGSTNPGTFSGRGNLIVGYNEGSVPKTGVNNLVVGSGHKYTSTGGAVLGQMNTIGGRGAVVSGGRGHVANGEAASVSGGAFNTASGPYASVSGGKLNEASSSYEVLP